MKLKHVQINNWFPPGNDYWTHVRNLPDEPLIEATLEIQLSHNEYQNILKQSREAEGLIADERSFLQM